MDKIKLEYKRLKNSLINPGYEQSMDEVMWNDIIYESIDNLFENVNKDIVYMIKKNYI